MDLLIINTINNTLNTTNINNLHNSNNIIAISLLLGIFSFCFCFCCCLLYTNIRESNLQRYNSTLSINSLSLEKKIFFPNIITICIDSNISENCSICLRNFEEDDFVSELDCKHKFHSECIIPWLKIKKNCPLCRYPIKITYVSQTTV